MPLPYKIKTLLHKFKTLLHKIKTLLHRMMIIAPWSQNDTQNTTKKTKLDRNKQIASAVQCTVQGFQNKTHSNAGASTRT